jgi:XRE family transcriptional regulator, fatty acid utilization regulator
MPTPQHARAATVSFGRRVRDLRIAAGFSQRELGRRAQVTDKFIGIVERGHGNPSLVTMELIADALGCELIDLIAREEPSPYLRLRQDDVRRAHEAMAVLNNILPTPHRRLVRR